MLSAKASPPELRRTHTLEVRASTPIPYKNIFVLTQHNTMYSVARFLFLSLKIVNLSQKTQKSIISNVHKAKKILGIFFSLVYYPGAMVQNW